MAPGTDRSEKKPANSKGRASPAGPPGTTCEARDPLPHHLLRPAHVGHHGADGAQCIDAIDPAHPAHGADPTGRSAAGRPALRGRRTDGFDPPDAAASGHAGPDHPGDRRSDPQGHAVEHAAARFNASSHAAFDAARHAGRQADAGPG